MQRYVKKTNPPNLFSGGRETVYGTLLIRLPPYAPGETVKPPYMPYNKPKIIRMYVWCVPVVTTPPACYLCLGCTPYKLAVY